MEPTYKTKIFFCNGTTLDTNADEKFNKWIKDHNNIKILNFQYQYYGNCHSLAILYLEGYGLWEI